MIVYNIFLQAIHGFRESEREEWSAESLQIIKRIKDFAFTDPAHPPMHRVHVLDLAKKGYIKPHIDSSRVSDLSSSCLLMICHSEST